MKVTIVAAYNKQVGLTTEFLDNMQDKLKYFVGENPIILVNGGCEFKIEHPMIWKRIDLPANEGFCKTLNAGLREVPVDSDYVFFVGNDSFPITTDWLDRLIILHKETDAWMICPANDRPGMNAYNHLYQKEFEFYWEVDMFPSIAWLMPYDKFKQIGLLDENFIRTGMYADNDYCDRIKGLGGKIVVSKDIMLKHLLSAEGVLLGTQSEDMMVNNEYYKKKYGK